MRRRSTLRILTIIVALFIPVSLMTARLVVAPLPLRAPPPACGDRAKERSPSPPDASAPLPRFASSPDPPLSLASLETLIHHSAPATLQLFADLSRTGRPVPPTAQQLVVLQQHGADAATLRTFIRDQFPASVSLRLAALRWIDRHAVDRPIDAGRPSNPAARAPSALFPGLRPRVPLLPGSPSRLPLPSRVGSLSRIDGPLSPG